MKWFFEFLRNLLGLNQKQNEIPDQQGVVTDDFWDFEISDTEKTHFNDWLLYEASIFPPLS